MEFNDYKDVLREQEHDGFELRPEFRYTRDPTSDKSMRSTSK